MKTRTVTQRIGDVFRRRREALGYSQDGFAAEIEMHRTYYSALERGEKNASISTLERVCDGLQTTVWEVFREAGRDG